MKIDPYVPYQQRNNNGEIVHNGFRHENYINNLKEQGFLHQGFTTGFNLGSQCRFMMVLNLENKDENILLHEMDTQTRWSIHKALKLGIKVRFLKEEELDVFDKIMKDTSKRKNFTDMSLERYKMQLRIYGSENAKICMSYLDLKDFKERIEKNQKVLNIQLKEIEEVLHNTPKNKKFINKKNAVIESIELLKKRKEDYTLLKQEYENEVPLSVAYFVFYEDEVVYVSSGSIPSLKKYMGPYAIQWHMITYSLQRNIKRYNFYGTSGNFDKSASDYGVYSFKKGFNAIAEELIGDFILPIHKPIFYLYEIYKKKNGE